jgi:hypothetical protein
VILATGEILTGAAAFIASATSIVVVGLGAGLFVVVIGLGLLQHRGRLPQ